jgi:NADH dehydrogenase
MLGITKESMVDGQFVTVFGGTGFLGRRVVRHLRDKGVPVRIASRHPERGRELFGTDDQVESIAADVHDERSVAEAISGAWAVVNAVSLYVEHGKATFASVHVEAAERIATQVGQSGVERLVHVSGIGADPESSSSYIRSRGKGELAVRAAFGEVTFIRPAVMFGPDDAFLTVIIKILRWCPAYPMFGKGRTRLQPAYVEDVAEAMARVLQNRETRDTTFECGGPRIYSYEDLLKMVAREVDRKPVFFPLPFAAWHILARICEILPSPPLTRNQVELMEIDNVARDNAPGFERLNIAPRSIEQILPSMLRELATGSG